MIPIVILCGGLATRLYPVTKTIPKSLINISGRPFIQYQLDMLKKNRVDDIVLCLGKYGEKIKRFIDSMDYDMNIKFSFDGDKQLGTGGAIRKALPLLSDNFFVMYGDSYLNISLDKMIMEYKIKRKSILMTIFCNNSQFDVSNIFYDGKKLIYDKKNPTKDMEFIDYGISIMNKSVFDSYSGVCDLSDIYFDFVKKGDVSVLEAKNQFYEIGSFDGIERFKKYVGGMKWLNGRTL